MSLRPLYLVGAGAVGSVLAAGLMRAGRPVTLIIRPESEKAYSKLPGLRISHSHGQADWVIPMPAYQTHYRMPKEAVVLVAVKHRDLESVMQALAAQEQPPQHIVCCLNGVSAARALAQRFPDSQVSALTVMFNAQLLDRLHAQITTAPELLLQTRSADVSAMLQSSDWKLKEAADASVAWGKLLINLANALCALTHTTFKDLLTEPALRTSFVLTLDEATTLLRQSKLRYQLPIPLPYWAYRWVLLHGGPVAWQAAKRRNGLTDQSYPSMVADLSQGKITEVQELNGEIVGLAHTMGLQAPVNQRICELVEARTTDPQLPRLSAEQLLDELRRA